MTIEPRGYATPASDEDDDIDHVPTSKEAEQARWLLGLPADERRMLMDLADAQKHRATGQEDYDGA